MQPFSLGKSHFCHVILKDDTPLPIATHLLHNNFLFKLSLNFAPFHLRSLKPRTRINKNTEQFTKIHYF